MTSSANIGNRPFGIQSANELIIPQSFEWLAFRGDYTGTNLIIKGFARPGSAEGALVWQLAKMAYDISNNLISIKWPQDANGHASSDFQFSWTLRGTYTFS